MRAYHGTPCGGQVAWQVMNLNVEQIKEINECFDVLGPDGFLETLRAAAAKKEAERA